MKKAFITSQKQFKFFEKCVYKWINFFGIKEFNVEVEFIEAIKNDCVANCRAGYKNKNAMIGLSTQYDKPSIFSKNNLDIYALHEVLHLLLWDFSAVGQSRYVEENEFENKEHEIIQKLINALLPKKV
jgi:hypothetical protein